MLTKTIMVLLMVSIVYSEWRWASDTMELTHDKEAHFVGSAGAYFFFRHKNYTTMESIRYSAWLNLIIGFYNIYLYAQGDCWFNLLVGALNIGVWVFFRKV